MAAGRAGGNQQLISRAAQNNDRPLARRRQMETTRDGDAKESKALASCWAGGRRRVPDAWARGGSRDELGCVRSDAPAYHLPRGHGP